MSSTTATTARRSFTGAAIAAIFVATAACGTQVGQAPASIRQAPSPASNFRSCDGIPQPAQQKCTVPPPVQAAATRSAIPGKRVPDAKP